MSQLLDNAIRRGAPVEKVTVFVMGQREGVDALLFLYHPNAGVQLPAGTVEAGESAQEAALREAQEETGLGGLVWGGLLGEEREEFAPDAGIVAQSTLVYTRADDSSSAMGTLRRGLTVEVVRGDSDFLQVRYCESDRFPDPRFTTFELLGWVPAATIAAMRIRYFAWLSASKPTPLSWTNFNDYHNFTLRWHRLDDLPEVVAPQAVWLRYLPLLSLDNLSDSTIF